TSPPSAPARSVWTATRWEAAAPRRKGTSSKRPFVMQWRAAALAAQTSAIAGDAFSAMASPGPPERYRFGSFELEPDKRRLLKDGATISLRPRAFDLLAVLVDHAGHLVTKDDLLDRVWPKTVVEEAAL